jgi:hypothetical protein
VLAIGSACSHISRSYRGASVAPSTDPGRAVELYHEARTAQQHEQRVFETQYGRADRIDAALLAELQHLQIRFAAIAARQQRQPSGQEPKVNRFVKALGEITAT